jgi:hypothetical protein
LYADAPGLVYSSTKHITRHRVKNGKEDLLKAITEIQKIIAREYPEPAEQVQKEMFRATSGEVTAHPGAGTGYKVARAPSDPGYIAPPVYREVPWQIAGGPNECEHGYARGLFCSRCYYLNLGTNGAQEAKSDPVGSLRPIAQDLPGATSAPAPASASEGIVQVRDLDGYAAEAALARANAYAVRRPDDDVPVGWVLEYCSGDDADRDWHFRKGSGGLWSAHYPSRSAALSALIAAKQAEEQ